MATGGDMSLTDDLIEKLSQVIETTKMETIASVYLGIPSVRMKNERFDNQGNATAFNCDILIAWRNKNHKSNQVKHLADILYRSAADGGYVNSHDVEKILGVPNTRCTSEETLSEEEFLSIAEALKPYAEQRMTIEPFPWFEDSYLDMDELYSELTLEKVEKKLLEEQRNSLQNYQEMFNCHKSEHKNKKILLKADPGMGKTTLGKKMTKDWATEVFKKFSIIFFVPLKFVKAGDTIESAILKQNPELEGLNVSQQKLRALLNRYSNRILIIFDGLDEHGLGQNEDVLKIIKNQKLLNCRILVSSRPHSTWGIEKYFPTIVRVEGFTEKEAKKFVQKFFPDVHKIEQIMQFRPSDSRENFPVHKCPILLAMLCFLVNKQNVDLSDPNISMGDLYFKMVECLFLKYKIKKDELFQESDLIQVMRSVGELALRTLLSNSPLLHRSEVQKIAGDFALEYGFFAVEKDFTDPTADSYVTWSHRSIEEFFGSFGFLQALDDGKSVDDILGPNCEKPLFMVNPLVFTFCIWLLYLTFSIIGSMYITNWLHMLPNKLAFT